MATLSYPNKRSFGQCFSNSTVPASCSPHKVMFLDSSVVTDVVNKRQGSFRDTSGPMKRLRHIDDKSIGEASTPALPMRESAFAGVSLPIGPADQVSASSQPRPKLCKQCQSRPAERVFSSEEAAAIVAKALRKSEQELRFEYDRVLEDRLAEQFHNFSKYYEDCISKMPKQRDFSYMS